MRYGVILRTFRLDHRRADHPRISPIPAVHAVGINHQRREWIVCPTCIANLEKLGIREARVSIEILLTGRHRE